MPAVTVIYHLNRFIDAGLLVKRGRKYYLRASEMYKAIEEIQYDMEREMKRMLDTAREFDKLMESGFQNSVVQESTAKKGKAKKADANEVAISPLQWNNTAIPIEFSINGSKPFNIQLQTESKAENNKKDVTHGKRKRTKQE